MKLKKKIKLLQAEIRELQKQIEKSSVSIVDSSNSNLRAVISFKDGTFLIEKIATTETGQTLETIFKDNK